MTEQNYFNVSYENLPSLGRYYKKGSSIKFRILNIRDLKFLAAINKDNSREMVNEILRRCLLLDKVKFEELLEIDRLSLVFYLRTNTFQLSNGYRTEFNCPYCHNKVMRDIKLPDIATKRIDEGFISEECIHGKVISAIYKKIVDKAYKTGERDLDTILNFTNCEKELKIVEPRDLLVLPADEYAKLLSIAERARCGVLGYVDITCPSCGRTLRVGIDLADETLFNKVSIVQMIKNRVQVNKYCGCDISDDMPYNEVEIMIAYVNELIEKEAEMMQKKSRR